MTDWATSSVKTVAAASSAASTSCLPLVSVPMQARWVPGLTWAAFRIGAKDEVMVMMTSASAPRRSRSTASNGRPSSAAVSARRESISGWRFQPITFSKPRWRSGGAHLEGGLVAGADHAEDLRVRAGEVLDRDGGGGGGAGGGQVVAADAARSALPVSGSKRKTVDWWLPPRPRSRLCGQ